MANKGERKREMGNDMQQRVIPYAAFQTIGKFPNSQLKFPTYDLFQVHNAKREQKTWLTETN